MARDCAIVGLPVSPLELYRADDSAILFTSVVLEATIRERERLNREAERAAEHG